MRTKAAMSHSRVTRCITIRANNSESLFKLISFVIRGTPVQVMNSKSERNSDIKEQEKMSVLAPEQRQELAFPLLFYSIQNLSLLVGAHPHWIKDVHLFLVS